MSESTSRRSLPKRILLGIGAFGIFTLLFMIAIRLAVTGIYRGIEANKATGLSAISPFGTDNLAVSDLRSFGHDWISRSAALGLRTNTFESSFKSLNQIVGAHHGNLEDLKTQSLSGYGRTLSANIAVPSGEFEAALSDLKPLGRINSIAEAGEDSAVKIAAASRHLIAAQTNLSRLQKLQRERKGELRDVLPLRKTSPKLTNPLSRPNARTKDWSPLSPKRISASRCWKTTAPRCKPTSPVSLFSFAIHSSKGSAAFSPLLLSFSASSLSSACRSCSGRHCSSSLHASPGAASAALPHQSQPLHDRRHSKLVSHQPNFSLISISV